MKARHVVQGVTQAVHNGLTSGQVAVRRGRLGVGQGSGERGLLTVRQVW
ncbi:hypothetical protein [Streptomyces sp. NPDC059122]